MRIKKWLRMLTREPIDDDDVLIFRDGMYLCKLLNIIRPNIINKTLLNEQDPKNNVAIFIEGCMKLGIPYNRRIQSTRYLICIL